MKKVMWSAGNYHCGIFSGHQNGSAGQGMLNEGRGPDKWKQRLAGEMDYRLWRVWPNRYEWWQLQIKFKARLVWWNCRCAQPADFSRGKRRNMLNTRKLDASIEPCKRSRIPPIVSNWPKQLKDGKSWLNIISRRCLRPERTGRISRHGAEQLGAYLHNPRYAF